MQPTLEETKEALERGDNIGALIRADTILEGLLMNLCIQYGCDEQTLTADSKGEKPFSRWSFTDYMHYLLDRDLLTPEEKVSFFRFHEWRNLAKHHNLEPSARAVETVIKGIESFAKQTASRMKRWGKVNHLIKTLYEGDEKARSKAALILGEIGDKRALGALTNIIEKSQNKRVLWSCIDALGKIGDVKATKSLVDLLDRVDTDLQIGIVDTLRKIPSKDTVNVLIKLLDKNPYIRWHVVDALGKIRDERSVDPLVRVLDDEDKCIRWWALDALIKIGTEKAKKGIKKAMKDENKKIREKAMRALKTANYT